MWCSTSDGLLLRFYVSNCGSLCDNRLLMSLLEMERCPDVRIPSLCLSSLLTFRSCFLQCPNDPRYAATLSSHETYCNDEVAYGTTTSAPISRPVSAAPSSATTSGSSGAQTTDSGGVRVASSSTASGTGATSTGTSKNGAEGLAIGAGSVLMGVAGLVGAFL